MGSSVITLPETDEYTLCLRFTGVVMRQDHYDGLVAPMRAMIEKHGGYNLVIHYAPDFAGWAPDAADQSFQSINEMGRAAGRIAYVNPPERKLFQTKLTRTLLGADVRNFENDELAAAIAWAKGGPP